MCQWIQIQQPFCVIVNRASVGRTMRIHTVYQRHIDGSPDNLSRSNIWTMICNHERRMMVKHTHFASFIEGEVGAEYFILRTLVGLQTSAATQHLDLPQPFGTGQVALHLESLGKIHASDGDIYSSTILILLSNTKRLLQARCCSV